MIDIIYNNKSIPSIKPGQLQRHRIDTLLSKAIEYPVVTVIAGAGYGKTQAVSMFLNKMSARVMWLQLSILDNHLTRFWDEFLYAISLINQKTALHLSQFGYPDSLAKFIQFLHILAKEVYTGEQLILVLDDFHMIQEESIINFIECLISAKLENFCVILISRKKPDLNFTSIATSDFIFQISKNDLYFTIEETENFYKMNNIILTGKELERIHTHTEGWPFALYLAGLSLKKQREIVSGKLIAGALPLIFEMIEREIFSEYTPQIQNFLIRLSLLNTFPKSLLKLLGNDILDSILKIISANMFINYNPHTKYYTFHRLFLDFLNEKQILLTAQEISDTYLIAADWCVAHDHRTDALIYYNKVNHHEAIWNILVTNPNLIFPKTVADLYIRFIDKFPEAFIKENPMVHVIRAGLLLNNADVEPAINELLNTQKELESKPITEENKIVLGEIYNMLGLLSLASYNYDFTHLFKKASEYLPNGGIINNAAKPVNTKYAISLHSPAPGELEKMEKALFYAMPYASISMSGYGYGLEYLASAEAAYFTGNLKRATKNAYEAIYRARKKHVCDVTSSAYFLLMRIAASEGDYSTLISHRNQLRAYTETIENEQQFNGMLDIAEGWLYVTVGQTKKVAGWIMDDTLSNKTLAPFSIGMERQVKASCLLKDGKYYELLAWLGPLESQARQNNLWLILLDVLISKSIAFYRIHDEVRAVTTLQEAYDIAHGNNLIMQFTQYGNVMRAFANTAEQSSKHHIPKEWLDSINAKANTYAKRIAFITTEYNRENKLIKETNIILSKREKDILTNIYQGLTREEIANTLYVSTSTVKGTLSNIYNKLGALNSIDAIRIALQMRII